MLYIKSYELGVLFLPELMKNPRWRTQTVSPGGGVVNSLSSSSSSAGAGAGRSASVRGDDDTDSRLRFFSMGGGGVLQGARTSRGEQSVVDFSDDVGGNSVYFPVPYQLTAPLY